MATPSMPQALTPMVFMTFSRLSAFGVAIHLRRGGTWAAWAHCLPTASRRGSEQSGADHLPGSAAPMGGRLHRADDGVHHADGRTSARQGGPEEREAPAASPGLQAMRRLLRVWWVAAVARRLLPLTSRRRRPPPESSAASPAPWCHCWCAPSCFAPGICGGGPWRLRGTARLLRGTARLLAKSNIDRSTARTIAPE